MLNSQAQAKCKNCEKTFTFTKYDSINAKTMKDAFKKTYMGEIFIHKCNHCGKENMVIYPVTYTDIDKNYMVQLVQNINDAKIVKAEHDKMCNDKVVGAFIKRLNYRIVIGSPFNFMKKVAILNYNLDEKKIDNMEKELKKKNGAMDCSFFVNPLKDLFYFILYYNDGTEEDIKFDQEMYNNI